MPPAARPQVWNSSVSVAGSLAAIDARLERLAEALADAAAAATLRAAVASPPAAAAGLAEGNPGWWVAATRLGA